MNQIAFSTLSCPAWDWERILRAATEYGYDAIELRGYLDSMDLPTAGPFAKEKRAATKRQAADAGLAICCVSSSGVVSQGNRDHVRAHCELARELDCPAVRVFGGGLPDDLPRSEGVARAAESLRAFGDAAEAEGVILVLETHDAFLTGRSVAELLDATSHPSVFALWDMYNSFAEGESPEETFRYIAAKTRYTHVKDGKNGKYTPMGEGDVPLTDIIARLRSSGYTGPFSVEWEKRWHPEIAEPEDILPQYAAALKKIVV